jgi:hypothetical protein
VRIRTASMEDKRRRSTFRHVSVKLISETCPLLWQTGDAHFWCVSPIMKAKETRAARGTFPFITKANTSHILSPITKARASPFIMKACASLIFIRETWVIKCRYPAYRVPLCTRLKRSAPWLWVRSRCQRALAPPRAPRHRARHLLEEGSGVATCPMSQSASPIRKGLWCCCVPQRTVCATRQERTLVLPHAPRHRARHPEGQGSGVATCLVAPGPPPTQEGSPSDQDTRTIVWQGFGTTTCPVAPDPPPGAGGLQNRRVPSGSRP